MPLILSDDFDAGPAAFGANWHGYPTSGGTAGGVTGNTVVPGGCTPSGYWLACNQAYPNGAFRYFPAPTGPDINVALQVAASVPDSTYEADLIWLLTGPNIGIVYILALLANGSFSLRWNNQDSLIYSPAGVAPVNGDLFALQMRMHQTGAHAVQTDITVNNVTVWSVLFDWSGTAAGNPGTDSTFIGLYLFPHSAATPGANPPNPLRPTIAEDNLQVYDSNAPISWSPCRPGLNVLAACGTQHLDGRFTVTTPTPIPVIPPGCPPPPCPTPGSGTTNNPGRACGVGFLQGYNGPWGVVPQHTDPIDGELLTGKDVIDLWCELFHS